MEIMLSFILPLQWVLDLAQQMMQKCQCNNVGKKIIFVGEDLYENISKM